MAEFKRDMNPSLRGAIMLVTTQHWAMAKGALKETYTVGSSRQCASTLCMHGDK